MKKEFIKFDSSSHVQDYFKNEYLFIEKKSELIISKNSILKKNINFSGSVFIDNGKLIDNNCSLNNCMIGKNNIIKFSSYLNDSKIKESNSIGPFAYIRDNVIIGKLNIIGSHTEITRTILKNNNKISHYSFIGDCLIANNNIIGAGVVTANYKSLKKNKLKTSIKNNCLIGSNSTIIAPCNIESNVTIAAGSKIFFDIKKNKKIIQKIS